MSNDAQQYVQQFEQIMTTIFTCRSIVKYNLVLSEEQKKQLVFDVDTALDVLRTYLITNIAKKEKNVCDDPSFIHRQNTPVQDHPYRPTERESETLAALYKMYRSYRDMQKNNNIQTYMKRFDEVMLILNELHAKDIHSQDIPTNIHTLNTTRNEAFQHVKIFIADIYYMLMDFIRALSIAWQQNSSLPDTEELLPMKLEQDQKIADKEQALKLLLDVYTVQQQLNIQKGPLPARISDVMAALKTPKHPATEASSYKELLTQLNNATTLLTDLAYLVTDYEKAAAALLSIN